ncbi:phage integrase SAM-like domain-containing protein [Clostridium botulinum]|uniref:phage integrase SAM-like domain-containing protein n=1 Tax=Clostridium botulinum TaxID=1491 RepID=UPI001FA6DC85|nr:phage integrase SAM-like domain-containing protein [Clostridium botulinum]
MKSYNQTLVLFIRYLEEEKNIIDINKINKEIVQEYIMFTRNRGKYSFVASIDVMIKANIDKRSDIGEQVSDATLNNYLRNIKVFFYWLDENHIIKQNTVCKCKFLKTERKSKEQLTDEKFKKLTRSINRRFISSAVLSCESETAISFANFSKSSVLKLFICVIVIPN